MATVLVVSGILLGGTVLAAPSFTYKLKADTTQQRFDLVLNALSAYSQRHYRLPCPADTNGAARGLERDNGKCFQNSSDANLYAETEGVVPWRELGLAESDVIDGWGRYITYKPAPHLTVDTYDSAMQSDAAVGDDIHNACRNQVWYDSGRHHLNRQKALFCCNSHPKTGYLAGQPNSSSANVAAGNWKRNAVVIAGTMGGSNAVANTANIASTNSWIDTYNAKDPSGAFYTAGPFIEIYDVAADAPLLRASGHAVTLISHGGNGYFSFMKNIAADTRLDATMNGAAAPTTSAPVASDETRNVWPANVFAGSKPHPKSNAASFAVDPLGLRSGASDDIVAYERSDKLFARSGAATCVRPARAEKPYTCPGFSYGNYMYILDNSGSMTTEFQNLTRGKDPTRWDVALRALMGDPSSGNPDMKKSIIRPHLMAEYKNDQASPDLVGFTTLTYGEIDTTVTKDSPATALLNADPVTGQAIAFDTEGKVDSAIQQAINSIPKSPGGGTPLLNTILKAAKAMGDGDSFEPSAIMVISDGEDTDSAMGYGRGTSATLSAVKSKFGYLKISADLQNLASANKISREEFIGRVVNENYPNMIVNIVDIGEAPNTQKITNATSGFYMKPKSEEQLNKYLKRLNSCRDDQS
ncbi:MAG: hypothetical protein HYU57_07850 [Micavibrio aeruginosavorus]|nr:hypothetical protein [Micavibrio aeruginosavorus]